MSADAAFDKALPRAVGLLKTLLKSDGVCPLDKTVNSMDKTVNSRGWMLLTTLACH